VIIHPVVPARMRKLIFAFLFVDIALSGASAQTPESLCFSDVQARITSAVKSRNHQGALETATEFEQSAIARSGRDSRCYAEALSERAVVLEVMGRISEADPIFKDALALARQRVDPDDPLLTRILNNYGVHLFRMRRYQEAAQLHEEALEQRKRHKPADQSAIAESEHNLADAYRYLGRDPQEVLMLYQEALALKLASSPRDDVSIAETRQNLASAFEDLSVAKKDPKLLKEASDNLEQALAIYRKYLDPGDPLIAGALNRQALSYLMRGLNKEAEAKFREALSVQRASAVTQQPTLVATLDDFSVNQLQLGRYDEAIDLARQALAIRRTALSEDNPTIARTLSNLSYLAWLKHNYDDSLAWARQASDITTANGRLDQASRLRYQRHLLTLWSKASAANPDTPSPDLTDEAFMIGQRAIRSDTAATVGRTALRFSARDPRLKGLLKQVDDLDRASDGLEQTLIHTLTLRADQADTAFNGARSELVANAARRKILLAEIEKSFPDYARLVNPQPLSAGAVQSLLTTDEALIAFVVGFRDVYVWCITRERLSWRKLDIDPTQLKSAVDTLRKGLDVEPQDASPDDAKKPLFNLGLANSLYTKLLDPISAQLASKSKLIVVPSGPLIGLPLHLLIAGKPTISARTHNQPEAFKRADWLINRYAISEIPSVESLEALRRRAAPSANRKPLIGFANPLPSPSYVDPKENDEKIASADRGGSRGQKLSRGLPSNIGVLHDVAALRRYLQDHPLRNTETELRDVAAILGADEDDLYIGPRATETQLKGKGAKLASYRIVYFATHGYLPLRFNEGEPSLALTVPEQPSEDDDGLLTASEVTQLTLDADWVVLSACDTASGNGEGAEGLSGLARAFFHAGARALLVSNWALDDESAQQIMHGTFQNLQRDRTLSKSQALRNAMLAQIKNAGAGDQLWDAYPGRWAAFEVVGVD
jgi:CHAT domain-containing protein/Tfp pilus assembly protein PilF